MKKFILIVMLFLIFSVLAKESEWSKYQGRMDWFSAQAKCKSIGMRLATLAEFESSFKASELKKWERDGIFYWSSDESSENTAYAFDAIDGKVAGDIKKGSVHVRCIK